MNLVDVIFKQVVTEGLHVLVLLVLIVYKVIYRYVTYQNNTLENLFFTDNTKTSEEKETSVPYENEEEGKDDR